MAGHAELRLVADLGRRAQAATVAQATDAADVVNVAVPLGAYQDLRADLLPGKVVIGATNNVAERDRANNSIFWERLRDDGRPSGGPNRRALPLAGDDPDAKQAAAQLLTDTGFDAVDAGTLEPM